MTPTPITPGMIRGLVPSHPNPGVAAEKLSAATARFGITSHRQVAMFLAMAAHESGIQPVSENLRYSIAAMMRVWPQRFPNAAAAAPYAFQPEKLANKVYAGRYGNKRPGDGWLFRGRGIFQLTFYDNYAMFGRRVGYDLVKNPDLLLQYGVGGLVAAAFFVDNGLAAPADRGDVRTVTRLLNGGYTGLAAREVLYRRALTQTSAFTAFMAQQADVGILSYDEEADLAALDRRYLTALSLF